VERRWKAKAINEKVYNIPRQHSGKTSGGRLQTTTYQAKHKRPGPDPVIDRYFAWFDRVIGSCSCRGTQEYLAIILSIP
jgi:hypothetical protein